MAAISQCHGRRSTLVSVSKDTDDIMEAPPLCPHQNLIISQDVTSRASTWEVSGGYGVWDTDTQSVTPGFRPTFAFYATIVRWELWWSSGIKGAHLSPGSRSQREQDWWILCPWGSTWAVLRSIEVGRPWKEKLDFLFLWTSRVPVKLGLGAYTWELGRCGFEYCFCHLVTSSVTLDKFLSGLNNTKMEVDLPWRLVVSSDEIFCQELCRVPGTWERFG